MYPSLIFTVFVCGWLEFCAEAYEMLLCICERNNICFVPTERRRLPIGVRNRCTISNSGQLLFLSSLAQKIRENMFFEGQKSRKRGQCFFFFTSRQNNDFSLEFKISTIFELASFLRGDVTVP